MLLVARLWKRPMARLHFLVRGLLACVCLVLLATACSKFNVPRLEFGEEEAIDPSVPLRVRIDLGPSVTGAAFPYKDACGAETVFPIGARLSEMLLADARKVFQEVIDRDDPSRGVVADAVLQFTVEEHTYQLSIPRLESWATYPAEAKLRIRATLREAQGQPGQGGQESGKVYSASFTGTGQWKVVSDADGIACELEGIGIPVNDALDEVSEQLVEALRLSPRIHAAATRLLAGRMGASQGFGQPGPPSRTSQVRPDDQVPPGLSFRVLLEDENGNRILEGGETVTLQVEVTNGGPAAAPEVAITLSGTAVLVQQFQNPAPLGTLEVGDRRHVTLMATLPAGITEQQSELVVRVTQAGSPVAPAPKRFIAWVRPAQNSDGSAEVLSVDVDQIPGQVAGFVRKNMYAVVVGIGTYRGDRSPSLAYAKRDAEVVAQYLQAVAGVPEENVLVLTDEYAVLGDLREAFERWLPKRVRKDSLVLVYVVGNALARKKTGEVYLLPYEGRSLSRYRVYPVAHLLSTLEKLPAKASLLFLDLSFAHDAGAPPPRLLWRDTHAGRKTKAVLVASSGVASQSLRFDRGQHGLFTYYFLKGLQGEADANGSGSISLAELFRYLVVRLPQASLDQGHQARIPVMVPPVPAGSRPGAILVGRVSGRS